MTKLNVKLYLSRTIKKLIFEIESLMATSKQHEEMTFKANYARMKSITVRLKMLHDELESLPENVSPELRGIAFLTRVFANRTLEGRQRTEYEDRFMKLMENY